MQNDLFGLLEAIAIARQAKHLIQQNTASVAVPNLAGQVQRCHLKQVSDRTLTNKAIAARSR